MTDEGHISAGRMRYDENWSVGRAVEVSKVLFGSTLVFVEFSALSSLQPGGWFAGAPRHDSAIAAWLVGWCLVPPPDCVLASIR